MRIKRTSWHYRWLCEWEGHEIHYMTACEYVGKFLLSIVASTLAVVAIIALALLAVGGLYLIGQSMFAAAAEWITLAGSNGKTARRLDWALLCGRHLL